MSLSVTPQLYRAAEMLPKCKPAAVRSLHAVRARRLSRCDARRKPSQMHKVE
jgi:hypothetical protein